MLPQKQQFIYTFDESENQFIALNTCTGQRVDTLAEDVCHLLAYFKKQEYEHKQRQFVLWCARQANDHIKAVQHKFFEVASSEISGKERKKQMHRVYQHTQREAIAVDTVGLTQRSSQAAAFLISRECVNPDNDQAAVNAARLYSLWAKLRYLEGTNPIASDGEIHQCLREAAGRQVNLLLELIAI